MPSLKHPLNLESIAYSGTAPGPRFIVTGAVHGNETCGTQGIRRVLSEIQSGALAIVSGSVTFVPVTNPLAYAKGERMGDRNLNRNLRPTDKPVEFEDHVANWLCPLLEAHDVLLDLHSTRADAKAFAMLGPRDNAGAVEPFQHERAERELAKRLGVARFVEGWLGTYAKGVERRARDLPPGHPRGDRSYGVGTTEYMRARGGYAITLECGQHEDPASPEVAYRAIRNALAFLGLTGEPPPPPVERYEALRMHEVIDRAHAADEFTRPWAGFDALSAGVVIATRHDGTKVSAPSDGRILFPDAKAAPGHEWFYLTETIETI